VRGRPHVRYAQGWLPTVGELACSPEVAILGSIVHALDIASVALVAAQPELQPQPNGRVVVCPTEAAEAADCVIVCANALAVAIDAYIGIVTDPAYDRR